MTPNNRVSFETNIHEKNEPCLDLCINGGLIFVKQFLQARKHEHLTEIPFK